jgi:hypothetical protein
MLRRRSPILLGLEPGQEILLGQSMSGGGQEFQEQTSWDVLPEDLYSGPPPWNQSVEGPGGTPVAGPIDGLAVPETSRLSPAVINRTNNPWQRALLWAIQQKGDFQQSAGTVGTVATLIRKAESRLYLLLQNTSLANLLFVAFGYQPQVVAGGATGFQLNANGGNIEPKICPQQDVWVIGNAASVPWVIAVVVN